MREVPRTANVHELASGVARFVDKPTTAVSKAGSSLNNLMDRVTDQPMVTLTLTLTPNPNPESEPDPTPTPTPTPTPNPNPRWRTLTLTLTRTAVVGSRRRCRRLLVRQRPPVKLQGPAWRNGPRSVAWLGRAVLSTDGEVGARTRIVVWCEGCNLTQPAANKVTNDVCVCVCSRVSPQSFRVCGCVRVSGKTRVVESLAEEQEDTLRNGEK